MKRRKGAPMVDWYWTVLNTGHCDLTPLMTLSFYFPVAMLGMFLTILMGRKFK